MKNKDFTIFIISHGRADNVRTLKTLQTSGYTGSVYIVIDNEDKSAENYKAIHSDKVIMFDKKAIADTTDEGDNFNDRRTTTHARNAVFNIAKDLGITYFLVLDDDYTGFGYRFDDKLSYGYKTVHKLDGVLDAMLDYYKRVPNLLALCMAQGGDYMGGANGSSGYVNELKPRRKAMNTFICSTERPFKFVGHLNEDVNTYVSIGNRGGLFLTIPNVSVSQVATQSSTGGMTEMYLDSGTYVKSFYTVMYQPSSVKIITMGQTHRRIHHSIKWKNTVPVLLDEKYKKSN